MSRPTANASLVSVLVPVRGKGAFLATAIASLRAQSHVDWEALLVGVGATDAVRMHADADPRIRIVDAVADDGAAMAGVAAQLAQGEFLCLLDGDDALAPEALRALLQALQAQPDAGMAYSRHVLVDANGNVVAPGPLCELSYSADALLLDFMTGPLQLMRRDAYERAGGYTAAFPDAADYDLCLRLSETCEIVHVPQPLYRRRVHPQSAAVARWVEQIEDRYRAFVAAVRRRGLDAHYDCALEIDSWHVLQPLRPFGGAGNWR